MNIALIVGRVGQDPDMKYFESGKVKTVFSVATNRWHSKEKKEITDWHNIECWDKTAEIAGEYVKKGKLVEIEGKLKGNKWTDNDGNNREKIVIVANRLKLLGGKKDE